MKAMRPSQLMASLVGSLPWVMCLRTSSVARLWRVNLTTDFSSSPDLSSHSRSTLKPLGHSSGDSAESQLVMAVCGVTAVCSRVTLRSLKAATRDVTNSSTLLWLLASVMSRLLTGSIQTHTLPRRGKAMGSKA